MELIFLGILQWQENKNKSSNNYWNFKSMKPEIKCSTASNEVLIKIGSYNA